MRIVGLQERNLDARCIHVHACAVVGVIPTLIAGVCCCHRDSPGHLCRADAACIWPRHKYTFTTIATPQECMIPRCTRTPPNDKSTHQMPKVRRHACPMIHLFKRSNSAQLKRRTSGKNRGVLPGFQASSGREVGDIQAQEGRAG